MLDYSQTVGRIGDSGETWACGGVLHYNVIVFLRG